ncbi:hypothetical protein J2Z44_001177 [Clostridium punense]|uniref:Uncharacterized protein n=1 Tax=Clostridium punense TaxID=1054297 RepID=A0ABS4K293_9CLOT|nr:hypothetical protein M918_16390 [Clostridium sp. BL8]MBP2021381.1 hypothetical protein [Clostridium punense]
MKRLLVIVLCVTSLNSVPAFHLSGTSYTKNGVEYINMKKDTILNNIFDLFDKKQKVYNNADLV